MHRALPAALICAALALAGDAAPEYAVKAAFLAHFGRFTTWPEGTFRDGEAKFRIAVLGEDPFGKVLDAVAAKPIQGRPVEVLRVRTAREAKGCHIVFVCRSEQPRIAAVLKALASSHILTVGETEGFAKGGGILGFVLEEGKVRFEVNPEAARRQKLALHPKLLKLGTVVEEEE